jgi:hypothetical protein
MVAVTAILGLGTVTRRVRAIIAAVGLIGGVGGVFAISGARLGVGGAASSVVATVHESQGAPARDVPRGQPTAASAGATTGDGYAVSCPSRRDNAGFISDWPGWRRADGFPDPCCILDVPTDLHAALPRLTWHPCATGADSAVSDDGACFDVDVPPGSLLPPTFFNLEIARDSAGRPSLVLFGHAIDKPYANIVQYELYDVATGSPRAAWRNDSTLHVSSCIAFADVSGDTLAMALSMYGPGDVVYAAESTSTAKRKRSFLRLTGVPWRLAVQDHAMSATTLAFDLEPGGIVYRTSVGAAEAAKTAGRGGPPLLLDFVQGDEVFALSGTGWTQEYIVRADGTPDLLRSATARHATGFAADARTLFWTEAYGGSAPTDRPTSFEVWSAPFTSDAHALAASARLLAMVHGDGFPSGATAADGAYAVVTGHCAELVDGASGAVREVCAGPGAYFGGRVFVAGGFLWGVVGLTAGPRNFTVRRIRLP